MTPHTLTGTRKEAARLLAQEYGVAYDDADWYLFLVDDLLADRPELLSLVLHELRVEDPGITAVADLYGVPVVPLGGPRCS